MRAFEENGRSIVTLVLEAVETEDKDTPVRGYLKDMTKEEMTETLLYLAGWVSGHFEDLEEWSTYLRQVDRYLDLG